MATSIYPTTSRSALVSRNRSQRGLARLAWMRRLETTARNQQPSITGLVTLVQPDVPARIEVLMHQGEIIRVTVREGVARDVMFRAETSEVAGRPSVTTTAKRDGWQNILEISGWFRLCSTPVRLQPATRPILAVSGVTTAQGSSPLPLPGKRQDRAALKPVILDRLAELLSNVADPYSTGHVYAENHSLGITADYSSDWCFARITCLRSHRLMLTGSWLPYAFEKFQIMTWNKGFEVDLLANEPWSLGTPIGSVL